MKRTITMAAVGCLMLFVTGCLNLEFGGGSTTRSQAPTIGQQLTDLQKAKDTGVINEAEYQAQRAKILNAK